MRSREHVEDLNKAILDGQVPLTHGALVVELLLDIRDLLGKSTDLNIIDCYGVGGTVVGWVYLGAGSGTNAVVKRENQTLDLLHYKNIKITNNKDHNMSTYNDAIIFKDDK